ncbi:MAG: branched-chain amino acid transport system substrate-binding protein [Burkholderiales bacterium]|jgi:branched-chain amino acid transport system substrate-binding protein
MKALRLARSLGWMGATLLIGLGSANMANAQQGDKIRIGMTVSSAGSFALASQSGVRGIDVWVDEVNSRGGIDIKGKKYKVELIKRDDRSDKQMVPRVYESLITDDKVDLLFGPFGSTLTAAAVTVTERHNKFLGAWAAASDSLFEQGFKYMFSPTQNPTSSQPRDSIALAAKMGYKKIAFLYSDEPFPSSLAENAKAAAEKHQMQVLMFDKYPKGQKDFSTVLQKAKAMGAEVLYPVAYEGDHMSMLKQMKQLNLNFPFTYLFYAATPQFASLGKDVDYIFSNTNYHPAIKWKVNAGYDRDQFAKAYARLNPNATYQPDFQTALGYGAGVIVEKIISTAGSTDAAELKKAAMALSGKLTVMAGQYEIDAGGKQMQMTWPVLQQQPGKGWVVVWPESIAAGKPIPVPDWQKRK